MGCAEKRKACVQWGEQEKNSKRARRLCHAARRLCHAAHSRSPSTRLAACQATWFWPCKVTDGRRQHSKLLVCKCCLLCEAGRVCCGLLPRPNTQNTNTPLCFVWVVRCCKLRFVWFRASRGGPPACGVRSRVHRAVIRSHRRLNRVFLCFSTQPTSSRTSARDRRLAPHNAHQAGRKLPTTLHENGRLHEQQRQQAALGAFNVAQGSKVQANRPSEAQQVGRQLLGATLCGARRYCAGTVRACVRAVCLLLGLFFLRCVLCSCRQCSCTQSSAQRAKL